MRKLMLLAAMLAMMLVAAAPALAQDAIAGDVDNSTTDNSVDNSVTQVSTQFQVAATSQMNFGNADALADGDGSASAATVSQDLSIDQSAVQNTVAGDDNFVFWWFWF